MKKPRERIEEMYERNIITYYFSDYDERFEIKGSRRTAKYARSAVSRAVDNMMMNVFGAKVCVVYDDYFGEDHVIIRWTVDGKLEVERLRDVTLPEVAGSSGDCAGMKMLNIADKRGKYEIVPIDESVKKKLKIK